MTRRDRGGGGRPIRSARHPNRSTSVAPEHQLLHRTRRGTALHCTCCGRVEVCFGNAVLALDEDDLRSVLSIIDSFDLDSAPRDADGQRSFLIRTQHDEAAFAFSRREALELRDLLVGARRALGSAVASPMLPMPRSVQRSLLH